MPRHKIGFTNKISIDVIDDITDFPERYDTQDLRRAIHDAWVHYDFVNASKDWYKQVVRICNAELIRRRERPEPDNI